MSKRNLLSMLALLLALGIAAACGRPISPVGGPQDTALAEQAAAGSVTPGTARARTATVEAQATPTPRATATPTRTRLATPTSTPTRRAFSRASVSPTATRAPSWPAEIVITEEQVEALAAASAVEGLTTSGLQVRFGQDSMTIRFDSLRYGLFSLRNVEIQGHLEVDAGRVSFVADRIVPSNLVTGTIPAFINQALDQALNSWQVEDLRVESGQLVLQVRPRGA